MENILERFSFISFLFKPPWHKEKGQTQLSMLHQWENDYKMGSFNGNYKRQKQ